MRWTVTTGLQWLGAPTGVRDIMVTDVSGDGSVIVANGTGAQGDRALLWTTAAGWADLTTVAAGLNVSIGSRILRFAQAISEDGNAIVGQDNAGRGYVLYRGREPVAVAATFTSFGAGCAGSTGAPTLAAESGSRPWLGTTFVARVDNLGGSNGAMILVGSSRNAWGSTLLPYFPQNSFGVFSGAIRRERQLPDYNLARCNP